MEYDKYDIEFTNDRLFYWFTSKNLAGYHLVRKIVEMRLISKPARYNLALADIIDDELN